MADNTNIEWADSTFNPWIGCTKVSPACDHCYAETLMDSRLHVVSWGAGQPRKRTSESNWQNPLRWEKEHKQFYAEYGRRRRVFCASLADVFDNEVPPSWRTDLLALIQKTPNIDWLILTKRIGNVEKMIMNALQDIFIKTNEEPKTWPWNNVWLGATICNQEEADRDIPKLLTINATVLFISIEPLLGSIDLTSIEWPNKGGHRVDALRAGYWNKEGYIGLGPSADLGQPRGGFTNHSDMNRIDWVIVGGESGTNARPMHPEWVRNLRNQCQSAGVPFFFKQWGEWKQCTTDEYREYLAYKKEHKTAWPDGSIGYGNHKENGGFGKRLYKIGKKAAGRLLDGVTHTEFPRRPYA